MNLKDIAKHYLTTRFVIHVIFSIPWYALAYYRKIDVECINDSCKVIGDDYRDVFSLLSFSRIIRIPEVSEVLNTLENNTLRFKFVYQALNIFSYALILFHFASCAQLNVHGIVLNMGDTDVSNSWVIKENFSELYGSGLVNQYGKTLYRASICLMLYGGISVNESIADRTLTSVLRIIGLMYLVYLLSYFIVILKSLNWGRRNFQYVMKNMNEMSKFKRLNQFQKDRIDHYMRYKYDWKFFNEMEVKAVLSTHLMNEIQDYCNRRAVEKVNLFESLPSNAKSLIVSSLKEDIYLPGDTIIEASVKGDCMYFLSIGKVAVYDPSGNEITHLKDGSYFGEVAMISDKAVRTASVVAIDICEVFVLYKHDFRSIIKPYPDLFATLRESVENILTTRMKDNVKYCKTKYSMIIESIEHLLHTVPIDNDNVE